MFFPSLGNNTLGLLTISNLRVHLDPTIVKQVERSSEFELTKFGHQILLSQHAGNAPGPRSEAYLQNCTVNCQKRPGKEEVATVRVCASESARCKG